MNATLSADEHFARGRARFEAGAEEAAFEHFRAAYGLQRSCARYASWYGLCLALVERRFNKGLELCRCSVKEEFFNPELYLNLARVHLAFGFKAEGLRYLRRGLMIDPSNDTIREEVARLGRRQQPVLRFLPRRHPLNRLLGRVRRRFGSAGENVRIEIIRQGQRFEVEVPRGPLGVPVAASRGNPDYGRNGQYGRDGRAPDVYGRSDGRYPNSNRAPTSEGKFQMTFIWSHAVKFFLSFQKAKSPEYRLSDGLVGFSRVVYSWNLGVY